MARKLIQRLGLLAVASVLIAEGAYAQLKTFNAPTHAGIPVGYCGSDPSVCGERVATAWCRAQGFEFASEWAALPGLDATTRAVRIDDASICQGPQCDAFATITCGNQTPTFNMPMLGAAGRATVIAPSRRTAAVAFEAVELEVMIPGCHQREPGVFLCETVHEYQHCRTLMQSGKVFSCRAGLAFDGNFATPLRAEAGDYSLELESSAEIRVEQGRRGEGRARGEAEFEIAFAEPELEQTSWCLQRDRYIYYPTGPKGGIGEIDDTSDCDVPIAGKITPNEDDVLNAYDLCNSFSAWGGELDHAMDRIVAALFTVGSASPRFLAEHGGNTTIVAPYVTIRAPVRVECRED